jgi:Transcription factor WhiB
MSGPACGDVDPEVFFGPVDSPVGGPLLEWERRALAVCGGCAVVAPCLREALRHPATVQHGVVGGMTAAARRVELATRGAGVAVARVKARAAVGQTRRAAAAGRASAVPVRAGVDKCQGADVAGVAR